MEAPSKKRKVEEEDDGTSPWAKKTKAEEESEKGPTLFAGNLSWNVDDDTLFEEFKEFSDLLGARVVTDKETGRSRGFGYIDFATSEAAEKAFNAKNGALIDNREIRLDFAAKRSNNDRTPTSRAAERAKTHGDVVSPESDTLFVGNISFECDEDTVREFFEEVCPVKSLRLPTEQ